MGQANIISWGKIETILENKKKENLDLENIHFWYLYFSDNIDLIFLFRIGSRTLVQIISKKV